MLPDRIFGLELGDAEYIRNAGGMHVAHKCNHWLSTKWYVFDTGDQEC